MNIISSFKRYSCNLVLAANLVCFSAGATPIAIPDIETLPNGLRVAYLQDDKLPLVDFTLVIQAGFKNDLPGKSGTAELLAAVLDRGEGEVRKKIESMAGSKQVTVDDDLINLSLHGMSEDAVGLLQILFELTSTTNYSEGLFESEKARRLESWKTIMASPQHWASFAHHRLLTSQTPYGRGSFVSFSEYRGIKLHDVVAFHKRWFAPKNSILMAVGRIDKEAIRKFVLSTFGAVENRSLSLPGPQRNYIDPPFIRKDARTTLFVVNHPKSSQSEIRIGYQAPKITSPSRPALEVANALIGEFFGSRLNTEVRDKLGLTFGIQSNFSYAKDLGEFVIATSTRAENTGLLIQKIQEELDKLRETQVPAQELEAAKKYLLGKHIVNHPSTISTASRWLAGYLLDLPRQHPNLYQEDIEKVTAKNVQDALVSLLNPRNAVFLAVGDLNLIQKSLKASEINLRTKVLDLAAD